jgi:hypothetical protein
MDNLLSFESFSKRVKNEMQTKLSEEKSHAQKSTTIAFENLLKKFDVSSPAELSEDKKEAFLSELFGNSTVSEAYTTVSGTPKSDAEKKVAKFLNAMAKEYDYPIENAIMATVAAIKKLGYEELVESNVSEAKVNSDEEFKDANSNNKETQNKMKEIEIQPDEIGIKLKTPHKHLDNGIEAEKLSENL